MFGRVLESGAGTSEFKSLLLFVTVLLANMFLKEHYGIEGLSTMELSALAGVCGVYSWGRSDLKKTVAKTEEKIATLTPLQSNNGQPNG